MNVVKQMAGMFTVSALEVKNILSKLLFADKITSGLTIIDFSTGILFATDSELAIRIKYPALKSAEKTDLVVSINTKQLYSVFSHLIEEVKLSTFGQTRLLVEAGKSKFELALSNVKPIFPRIDSAQSLFLPLQPIKPLLKFISSIATRNTNYAFSELVHLESKNGLIKATGTDTVKMGLIEISIPEASQFELNIPVRAVQFILETEWDVIEVIETENALIFKNETMLLHARKIFAKFPDIEKYIPDNLVTTISFDAQAMQTALKRVSSTLNELKMVVLSSDGEKLVLSTTSQTGSSRDEINVETLLPDPLFELFPPWEIYLSHPHLLDFFEKLDGLVKMSFKNSATPILFQNKNILMIMALMQ